LREEASYPLELSGNLARDLLNERRCICGTELIETLLMSWCNLGWIRLVLQETAIHVGAQADEIDKQALNFGMRG